MQHDSFMRGHDVSSSSHNLLVAYAKHCRFDFDINALNRSALSTDRNKKYVVNELKRAGRQSFNVMVDGWKS